MDIKNIKGAAGSKIDGIIDQAAGVAKEKVTSMIGGEAKQKKEKGVIGDALSGVAGKVAAEAGKAAVTDAATSFVKKFAG